MSLATNLQPSVVASTVTVDRYHYAAAAAYLMRHHGAAALLILDGTRSNRPAGIITEADLIQAAADGKDLNTVRVHELMSQNDPARPAPGAAGPRAGSPAGR
jgi:CBS domain-containing protein